MIKPLAKPQAKCWMLEYGHTGGGRGWHCNMCGEAELERSYGGSKGCTDGKVLMLLELVRRNGLGRQCMMLKGPSGRHLPEESPMECNEGVGVASTTQGKRRYAAVGLSKRTREQYSKLVMEEVGEEWSSEADGTKKWEKIRDSMKSSLGGKNAGNQIGFKIIVIGRDM